MKTKLLIIFILFVGIKAFSSCEKITNSTLMYYDETGCMDPWRNANIEESEKTKKIEKYLKDKKIKVFEVNIINDGTMESCEACHCKSGNRVHAKIRERDVNKAKKVRILFTKLIVFSKYDINTSNLCISDQKYSHEYKN